AQRFDRVVQASAAAATRRGAAARRGRHRRVGPPTRPGRRRRRGAGDRRDVPERRPLLLRPVPRGHLRLRGDHPGVRGHVPRPPCRRLRAAGRGGPPGAGARAGARGLGGRLPRLRAVRGDLPRRDVGGFPARGRGRRGAGAAARVPRRQPAQLRRLPRRLRGL
ncbi:MAG: hypothetical protein AVDCRST_MAG19-4201, partial [uncultured Thermomicrobiales bacterium]